jgi:hypothetical protein
MSHEAQSLHARYGLVIALSTFSPCRYLNEPKTRFPVGRLFPLPGRESHPLKAPGLSWRTEFLAKGRIGDKPTRTQNLPHIAPMSALPPMQELSGKLAASCGHPVQDLSPLLLRAVTAPYTQRKPWYQSAAGRLTNLPFEHYRVPLSPIQVDADEWASLNRQFCLLSLSATPPLRARITLR